jgi:competence protein ComEA
VKTRQLISSSALSLLLGFGALAPRAMAQDLAEGPGKDVVVKACTSCHDADNITSKKHTKEEWKGVVDTMVAYGAEVSDEQTEIITTYLAKNYGKANLTAGRVQIARPRR